jgi:glucuronate isomerase
MPSLEREFPADHRHREELYFDHGAKCPRGQSCHVPPQDIAEDKQYENVTRLFLGGGGYATTQWRLMRANGVEERFITGDPPTARSSRSLPKPAPRHRQPGLQPGPIWSSSAISATRAT